MEIRQSQSFKKYLLIAIAFKPGVQTTTTTDTLYSQATNVRE